MQQSVQQAQGPSLHPDKIHRPGRAIHPGRRGLCRRGEATLAAGKMPCCNTYSPEDFAAKQEAGFQAITLRSDMDLLVGGGRELLGQLQKIAAL